MFIKISHYRAHSLIYNQRTLPPRALSSNLIHKRFFSGFTETKFCCKVPSASLLLDKDRTDMIVITRQKNWKPCQ